MATVSVEGRRPVKLLLYTLSTCGWCRKTKSLLTELEVGYDYVDIDKLPQEERDRMREEVMKWNPTCSFPTIIVDDHECIVGFKEEKLRELLQ